MTDDTLVPEDSSFRDRDGFVFYSAGKVYRAINASYQPTWHSLNESGLTVSLLGERKLIPYESGEITLPGGPETAMIVRVQKIPFISYPPEWTFDHFQKAAILTLEVQAEALKNNFILKEASAYNVQFIGTKPVFIDLQAFARYEDGQAWLAYGQFCRHFLAPLVLMSYGYAQAGSFFVSNIDGVPLETASRLLPFITRFSPFALTHIHWHARSESRPFQWLSPAPASLKGNRTKLLTLTNKLLETVRAMKMRRKKTSSTAYTSESHYSREGLETKLAFIDKHLALLKANVCVDLGSNTGEFSELASRHCQVVVACDKDIEVVRTLFHKGHPKILPLCVDLRNPPPAYGWAGRERKSFLHRIGQADVTLALGFIHHLCIAHRLPLANAAEFFSGISKRLIIEFIPKSDPKAQCMPAVESEVFNDYTLENFMRLFTAHYKMSDHCSVPDSERMLFFFEKE
jgi:hypothetical protein